MMLYVDVVYLIQLKMLLLIGLFCSFLNAVVLESLLKFNLTPTVEYRVLQLELTF